jgi:ubiquinol-cytochrome c reductase cytochrome c1 subunit
MRYALSAAAFAAAIALASPALAVEDETPQPPPVKWSFSGPFGTYDMAQLQRGFQVYNEVCSACHSMKLLSYRNLEQIGLTPAQVKAIAATKTVPGEPNSDGQPTTRPALPSDHFASPFPNDQAARAANNGYVTPPADFKVPDGSYYNLYFPGQKIHMPPPLSDGAVTYADGTKATVDQMGKDVAAFLTWASNPEMDARKHMGVRMVGFFALLACVTYGVKRKIWADIH